MKKTGKSLCAILILALALLCASCGSTGTDAVQPAANAVEPAEESRKRDSREIVEELAVYYGSYGSEADETVRGLLDELKGVDSTAAGKWESIMELWRTVNAPMAVNYDVLPDGLPDTDELGIVALGFQLKPDGTMRDELIGRLGVVLKSAEKYPNAYVICTGGGTASANQSVTEAGAMAAWLEENGIDRDRLIVEDRSLTTAQNAMYTYQILTERYPRVTRLAIVSSDYHIATGTLLFGAEATLQAEKAGAERLQVVSNAAYQAPTGTLSTMFQAGALIELSGDADTAFKIYYEEYDIHELPPLP